MGDDADLAELGVAFNQGLNGEVHALADEQLAPITREHIAHVRCACATQVWSKASPVPTEQSCVELHMSGVTNEQFDRVPLLMSLTKLPLVVVPMGTSLIWHDDRSGT